MSKKFKHLNLSPHWQQYFSKYPDGYTIIENLIDWVSQVDNMVDNVNDWNEYLVTFVEMFDTNLQTKVTETLTDWQNSGFLNMVINETLETKYHEMNKRLSTQLDEDVNRLENSISQINNDMTGLLATKVGKGENETVSMAMLHPNIKEAINNGTWDINVNTSDLEAGSISHLKLDSHYNYDVSTNFVENGDMNLLLDTGFYLVVGGSNRPTDVSYTGLMQVDSNNTKQYVWQKFISVSNGEEFTRIKSGNIGDQWTPWRKMNEIGSENLINESVTPEKTSFIHVSKNLFNPETLSEGYINAGNGNVLPTSSNRTSDFIEVKGNTSVSFNPHEALTVNIAFYDKNKVFKIGTSSADLATGYYNGAGCFTLPRSFIDTEGYFRISTNSWQEFMLNYGTEPLPFEPYGDKLKREYLDLPNTLNPLQNKTVAVLGDSIIGNNNDVVNAIQERTLAKDVINLGFGGTRITQHAPHWDAFSLYRLADELAKPNTHTSKWALQDEAIRKRKSGEVIGMPAYFDGRLETLKTLDFNNVDILVIAGGNNDFTAHVDIDNPENKKDTTTVSGSLRHSIEKIMSTYTHLNVFISTPMFCFWSVDGTFSNDSNGRLNNNGDKLPDIVEAQKNVAKEYQIVAIDNYYNLGINRYNRLNYFGANDGIHPNKKGGQKLGSRIGAVMTSEI